jgi:hypothetical protein
MDDGRGGPGSGGDAGPSGHERFARDALAHVLGGLARPDSDGFRTHLRTCADCRARVAELRGISSSLDAAAREERRLAAGVVTAPVTDRPRRPEAPVAGPSRARRLGAVLAALALVSGVGFWNLHLRTRAATYYAVADERGAILRDLATGVLVDDPALSEVAARVAVTPMRVVVLLADAGPLAPDERVVAWLLPAGSGEAPRVLAAGPAPGGELAARLARGGATTLVVTRERGPVGTVPAGHELVRVGLGAR